MHPRLGAALLAPGSAAARPAGLDGEVSEREVEVLRRVAEGYTNAEFAAELYVSVRTVESHRAHLHKSSGSTAGPGWCAAPARRASSTRAPLRSRPQQRCVVAADAAHGAEAHNRSEGGAEWLSDPPNRPALCPVCDLSPTVLVAVRHPIMRRWTGELLAAEHGCWSVTHPRAGEMVADAIAQTDPALVIVDSADFPACCQAALRTLPPKRVIVVGPEPDCAYRSRALGLGAGGWVCRDNVGEELSAAMRAALGCCHHQLCPPRSPASRPPAPDCVTTEHAST